MRGEAIRFALVLLVGLIVDLALAAALVRFVDASLPAAAAAGFCAGAASNYMLHEAWTFRRGPVHLSWGRALRYLLVLGAGLMVRVGTVAVVTMALPALPITAVLAIGVGASFVVNFAASRFFVFRRPNSEQEPYS